MSRFAARTILIAALTVMSTASSAAVFYSVEASTSDGSPLLAMPLGSQLILDITVRTDDQARGVAGSVNNYDTTIVSWSPRPRGVSRDIFNQRCVPGGGCVGGLVNQVSGSIAMAERMATDGGYQIEFLAALGLTPAGGNGEMDPGILTGVPGDPQFRLVFNILGVGSTTLNIGSYAEYFGGYLGTVDDIAHNRPRRGSACKLRDIEFCLGLAAAGAGDSLAATPQEWLRDEHFNAGLDGSGFEILKLENALAVATRRGHADGAACLEEL